MSLVENPQATIVKTSHQHAYAYPDIRDVRKGEKNRSTRLEKTTQLFKHYARVVQMLEHVSKDDCVVLSETAQVHLLDVAHKHVPAVLAGKLGHRGILLNACNRAAQLRHFRRHVAGCRADLQYFGGSLLFDPVDYLCMAAVRVSLLVNVSVSLYIVFRVVTHAAFVKSVSQGGLYAVESISKPVNVAYLVTIVSGDGPLGYSQTRFVELYQSFSIEMPFVGIQQKGNFLQRFATVESVAGMELRKIHPGYS